MKRLKPVELKTIAIAGQAKATLNFYSHVERLTKIATHSEMTLALEIGVDEDVACVLEALVARRLYPEVKYCSDDSIFLDTADILIDGKFVSLPLMKTKEEIEAKILCLEELRREIGVDNDPYPIQAEINVLNWVLGKN